MSFLSIVQANLIPTLERMICDEEKHLNYLKGIAGIDVSAFIIGSEENLAFLKIRLEQYKDYAAKVQKVKPYLIYTKTFCTFAALN